VVSRIPGGALDEFVSRTDPSGSVSPLTDLLGSVIATTDAAGVIQTEYTFDPFGNTTSTGATSTNQYQFASRENDGNGLYYYRARYYDPTINRFISEDPMGYAGSGPNLYAYVHDNPTNLVDPFGLQDNASPWQVGWEWLTGTGPRVHNFTDGDPFTELLRHHEHIQDLINGVCNGTLPENGRFDYSLSGTQGVPKYLKDYSTLFTGGLTGNLAVTYLGSYGLSYSVTNGVLDIKVWNTSSIASATHPPVVGYTDWWNNNIGDPLNNFFSSGPMSATTQNFDFHEDLGGRGCGCKH
jgi:RHS repeat-associated protein